MSSVSAWSSSVCAVTIATGPMRRSAARELSEQPVARFARRVLDAGRRLGALQVEVSCASPSARASLRRPTRPRRANSRAAMVDGGHEELAAAAGHAAAPSARRDASCAMLSAPPETARMTIGKVARGAKSASISSSRIGGQRHLRGMACARQTNSDQVTANSLALRLGAHFHVLGRVGEPRRQLAEGRAGGVLLAEPVERHGELQQAVGGARVAGVVLVALEEASWRRPCIRRARSAPRPANIARCRRANPAGSGRGSPRTRSARRRSRAASGSRRPSRRAAWRCPRVAGGSGRRNRILHRAGGRQLARRHVARPEAASLGACSPAVFGRAAGAVRGTPPVARCRKRRLRRRRSPP